MCLGALIDINKTAEKEDQDKAVNLHSPYMSISLQCHVVNHDHHCLHVCQQTCF